MNSFTDSLKTLVFTVLETLVDGGVRPASGSAVSAKIFVEALCESSSIVTVDDALTIGALREESMRALLQNEEKKKKKVLHFALPSVVFRKSIKSGSLTSVGAAPVKFDRVDVFAALQTAQQLNKSPATRSFTKISNSDLAVVEYCHQIQECLDANE